MNFMICSDSKINYDWNVGNGCGHAKIYIRDCSFLLNLCNIVTASIISSYMKFNKYVPMLCNGNPVKITVLLY